MSLIIVILTDLIAITILASVLYFRRHRRRDLQLSYIALNVGVLAVTIALSSVEVGIGLGIGLFGILSIIRLRSDQITQQEIAYYFVSLALGLLAGLKPEPLWVAPALSALMLLVMLVADSPLIAPRTRRYTITLDRAYTDEPALMEHLEATLGRIAHVEVLDVDLVRDTTRLDVRYTAGAPASSGGLMQLPHSEPRSLQATAREPRAAAARTPDTYPTSPMHETVDREAVR